jgi:YebC/PmpR family DNA-binding regulatory protein
MSGHSHWHSIKYKKGAADAKKGKVFSKISREITIAARESGGDPDFNPKLRMAVERARSFNMPADNIERAIKKGTGELEGEKLEEVLFEAYGPGGIALIIEGITDNKNRTLGEIKQILSQYNGKLVGEGGVRWMFERKVKEPGSLEWVAKQEIELSEKDKETAEKLFEALDENDAVQEIYSNLKV